MEKKYCSEDGKKLVRVEESGFDTQTGKKNFHLECPTGLCGHTGIGDWFHYGHAKPGKYRFFGGRKCEKCGEEIPVPDFAGI